MFATADPAVDQFVRDHLLLVGGATITVFTAGCAVGRFVFDRLVATLRAEAEEFKNQRDEARRQLQEARLQVAQSDKGVDLQVKAKSEASQAQAAGRFFSAIATILLLSLVGYNLYLQTLLSKTAASESLRNAEFQKKTEAAIQAIQAKLIAPAVTKPPTRMKPNPKPAAEKQDSK